LHDQVTHAKDRNDEHVQFSLKALVHLVTNLFDLIFDREGVIADVDFGLSPAGLIELALLDRSVLN
jgi:hypothetical protein